MHVLKYLKGCPFLGIFISSSSKAYSDVDRGNCKDNCCSLTYYCIFIGDTLLSWKCKNQQTVSSSSTETEYRALSETVKEVLWLAALLQEFGITPTLHIPLFCDNHATLHITKNQVFHERTKHLDIDCHLVHERFKSGFLQPTTINTIAQLADIFTKALPGPCFCDFLSKMALSDPPSTHKSKPKEVS